MSGRAATTDITPGKYAIAVGIPDKSLPQGWMWHRLTDIAEMATGHTPSRVHPEYWDGDVAWIGIKDARVHHGRRIDSTFQTVTPAGIENSASVVLPKNTVCLSRTASVGYVTIMDRPMATSQDFVNWICSAALVPEFLMYLLIAERESLLKFGKGTTHTTIYFPEAKALAIGVPPVSEQRRIVAKIEELFSDLNAGVAALERVRAKLKRYRAAVLNAAVTGKLTEAWRRQNPPAEPADKLLARILEERRQKWEADQLRKFAEAGKTPPKGWREKYEEPSPAITDAHTSLPAGWRWATVEQLGQPGEQTVLTGPFGSTLGREDFIEHGVPLLTIGCLTEGGIRLSKALYVSPKKAEELERYRLRSGDLLFSRSASVGRVGNVTPELQGSLINYHLMRLRLASAAISTSFFVHFVRGSAFVGAYLRRVNHGATRDGINTADLLAMPIALPPAPEQAQINQEVESRLSVVESIESEVDHGVKRATRLRQAILKRAFEGKLVPQDPSDEPAAELLKRLKASDHRNAAAGPEPKPRRPRKAAASIKEGFFDAR